MNLSGFNVIAWSEMLWVTCPKRDLSEFAMGLGGKILNLTKPTHCWLSTVSPVVFN